MSRAIASSVIAAAALSLSPLAANGDDAWTEVLELEEIPLNDPATGQPYQTWSLFLICNSAWLDERDQTAVDQLFSRFKVFGDQIGSRNLAVWFAKAESNQHERAISLDVTRSMDYCYKYEVVPSYSPYVIVTTQDPNLDQQPGNLWRLSFSTQSDRQIRALIDELVDQIRAKGLDQEILDREQWWRSWYSILDHTLQATSGVLKRVTLTIRTPFFSVEAKYG